MSVKLLVIVILVLFKHYPCTYC